MTEVENSKSEALKDVKTGMGVQAGARHWGDFAEDGHRDWTAHGPSSQMLALPLAHYPAPIPSLSIPPASVFPHLILDFPAFVAAPDRMVVPRPSRNAGHTELKGNSTFEMMNTFALSPECLQTSAFSDFCAEGGLG